MKNTGKCSKCHFSDVIRIRGWSGTVGQGNNIPVGWTVLSMVDVTRFLCGQCGYSEEWVEKPADIEKVRKKYG